MTQAAAPNTGFTIFGEEMAQNPYPVYERLRAASPVTPLPNGLWAVACYDDVVRILRDPETFSSVVSADVMAGAEPAPSMIFNDPPMHTRLRGLISRAFTPRMVERQRPAVEAYCKKLVGRMLEEETADFVAALAYPLPIMVIANMLGVADGDHATFKRWSDAIIENVGTQLILGDTGALNEINEEFDAYFKARLGKLRREPEDNLLSGLVHAETEDGRLSESDLLVICRLLLVAGNETTTGLIVNSIRVFSEFPDVMTRVKDDLSLIPTAIEEILRYYAPFQATFRRATRDVVVHGVTIPKDDRIVVLLASANRDASVFDRPDEVVVDRDPNRHLSFGMGIHYCLGAPLARMEGAIALRMLLPRLNRVEILETDAGALLRPGGPKSLRVRFELDRASVPA